MHGGPLTECDNPDIDWYPQRSVCWPTAQLEAARRLYAQLHEERPYHDGSFKRWAKEPSPVFPFHYMDGVTIWVSRENLTPDDDWLEQGVSTSERELPESEGGD